MNSRLGLLRSVRTAACSGGVGRVGAAHVSRTGGVGARVGERVVGGLLAALLVVWVVLAPPWGL